MSRDPVESLLARLDGLAFRLDRSECPEITELEALASAAADAAVGADLEARRRLAASVARVSTALAQSCVRLDERIATTAVGRRAVRGYGANQGARSASAPS
ncbi:MAG: hypothetical protein V4850_14415 [Myxococcota bacterium]